MNCLTVIIICVLVYLCIGQKEGMCIDELQNFHNQPNKLGDCLWEGAHTFKRRDCNRALHETDTSCGVYAAGYPSIRSMQQCQALKSKYPVFPPDLRPDMY